LRVAVAAIAWTRADERCRDLARALGAADADVLGGTRIALAARPRHLVELVRTVAFLARRRPATVVVQAPAADAALAVLAYAVVARARLVVDAHTGAFLGGRLATGILRVATRRAVATIVPTGTLAAVVRSWGGRPVVLHEPPPATIAAPARPVAARPRVLVIGQLARDEPVAAVLAAARSLPDLDLVVVGDRSRLAGSGDAPGVRLPGFLEGDAYLAEISAADVIVALTDREHAVLRGACEAVWHGRPLVTSRTAAAEELFPLAVLVDLDAASIAAGIAEAVASHAELVAAAPAARDAQAARFASALADLAGTLSP
jgi:glycosyltransferase involved in cell wall biosynthesis